MESDLRAAGFSVTQAAAIGTPALPTAVTVVSAEPGLGFGGTP